jgi:hypothetical protein
MFTKCYLHQVLLLYTMNCDDHQVLLLYTMNCDERLWNTFVGRVSISLGPTFWRECSPIVEYDETC